MDSTIVYVVIREARDPGLPHRAIVRIFATKPAADALAEACRAYETARVFDYIMFGIECWMDRGGDRRGSHPDPGVRGDGRFLLLYYGVESWPVDAAWPLPCGGSGPGAGSGPDPGTL
jgi:hypothetical protein